MYLKIRDELRNTTTKWYIDLRHKSDELTGMIIIDVDHGTVMVLGESPVLWFKVKIWGYVNGSSLS